MKDCDAKFIITLDILFPRVSKIKSQTNLQHVIITAIKDFLPFPKNLIYPFIQKKQYGIVVKVKHDGPNHLLTEILRREKRPLLDYEISFEEDVALIQYTGGTTGGLRGPC